MSPGYPPITAHLSSTVPNCNTPDYKWIGDTITQRDDQSTRVMFHNIHGLHLQNSDKTIEFLANEQVAVHVNLLGISETNLDTNNFRIHQQLRHSLARHFPGTSTMQFDTSPAAAQSAYKPGGTGILSIGATTSLLEVNGKGGDALGRWSYMHFRRKNMPPVTVISAYQVCTTPTNAIGNTAWHQQKRALIAQGRDIHPRKAFIDDLTSAIKSFQAKHHDIILGGDFNEIIDDPSSGLLRLVTATQLTDPWEIRFPTHPKFNTSSMDPKELTRSLYHTGLFQQ